LKISYIFEFRYLRLSYSWIYNHRKPGRARKKSINTR